MVQHDCHEQSRPQASQNEILLGRGERNLAERAFEESQVKFGHRGIGQGYEVIFVHWLGLVTYEHDVEPRGQKILIDWDRMMMNMGGSGSPRVVVDFVLSLRLIVALE